MTEFIVTIGLPASGKSTLAKQLVRDSDGTMKRVNRDDLRAMLDCGTPWHSDKEVWVKEFQRHMIVEILSAGVSVICDDTNLDPNLRAEWKRLAMVCAADHHEIDLTHIPVTVLYERDAGREEAGLPFVGADVIDRMYDQWFPVSERSWSPG